MAGKHRRKSRSGSEGKKKVELDRLTVILALGAVACSFLWSILATYILYDREKQNRTKIETLLDDVRESKGRLQKVSSETEALKRDVDGAKITHRDLGILFQQLLIEERRPKTREEMLKSFDRLFTRVSGKAMTYKEREALIQTTNTLWGDGTRVASTTPAPEPPTPAKPAPPKPVAPPPSIPVVRSTNVVPPPPPKGLLVNEPYGFKLVFPDDWEVNKQTNPGSVIATGPRANQFDLNPASVMINARKMNEEMTLADFVDLNLESLTGSFSDYEQLAEGPMQVGGQPARFMKCRYQRLSVGFEAIYILVVKKEMGYVLTFKATAEAFPEYQKTFNDIYKSVVFM